MANNSDDHHKHPLVTLLSKVFFEPSIDIAGILEKYLINLDNLEFTANNSLSAVRISDQKLRNTYRNKAKTISTKTRIKSKGNSTQVILEMSKQSWTIIEEIKKVMQNSQVDVLYRALFYTLFSSFDALTTDLLTYIYLSKQDIMNSIERSCTVHEIMEHSSIQDILRFTIDKEVESFKRDSYRDQFELLEKRFGLSLTKFEKWPQFIEICQRRNILMHCDGKISRQYLAECKRVGIDTTKLKIGDKLYITEKYFQIAIMIFREIGIKLSHTLWRKIFPNQIENSDNWLNDLIYSLNQQEKWAFAIAVGEYCFGLPKYSSDQIKKTLIINYAIALKQCNEIKKMNSILQSIDWSSSADEYLAALAILRGNYAEAIQILKRIGAEGQLIKESSYLEWPLFNDLRKRKAFLNLYKELYGRDLLYSMKVGTQDRLKVIINVSPDGAEMEIEK